MRTAPPTRPRLHRVLAPVAVLVVAAAAAPAALVLAAAGRQAPRAEPAAVPPEAQPRPALLRACSGPNGPPFSNARSGGVENAPIELLASDRGRPPRGDRRTPRRTFVREAPGEGRCDVVIGVPTSMEGALSVRPSHRPTSVLVSGTGDGPRLSSRPLDRYDVPRAASGGKS